MKSTDTLATQGEIMQNETAGLMKNMVVEKPVNFDTHTVVMQTFTWHREKHSLFDTEAKDDKLSKMYEQINEPLNIIRKEKEVTAVTYNVGDFDPSVQHMLRIININKTFYLELMA
jgi:hypothetical protein